VIPPDRDRTERAKSLRADRDKVLATFDQIDEYTAAHGLVIVACDALDVYEVLPLAFPVDTHVVVDPEPGLADLARYAEDYPRYAVLLLDQKYAVLTIFAQGRPSRSVRVRGSGYPRKQMQGGWSQHRYEGRAEERSEAFVRRVAEETRSVIDESGVPMLVLAGDDRITSAIEKDLHETIQSLVIGTVNLKIESTPAEMVEVVQPIVDQAERDREATAVQAVHEAIGMGTGAGGAADVMHALQAGQVDTLVMNDDFQGTGWADYTMYLYGVGSKPETHPAGGGIENIREITLDHAFVRLALYTNAEIEIVASEVPVSEGGEIRDPEEDPRPRSEPAKSLDEFGGVGAILRFTVGTESGGSSRNA
jgi:peptide subunit release factor 1 (eRF1)